MALSFQNVLMHLKDKYAVPELKKVELNDVEKIVSHSVVDNMTNVFIVESDGWKEKDQCIGV